MKEAMYYLHRPLVYYNDVHILSKGKIPDAILRVRLVYLKQRLKSFHTISYIHNTKRNNSYLPSVLIFMPRSGDVTLQQGFSNNVVVSFK